ncbi:MAG: acyl-CoA dehydrogenase family protein [Marmoricola sp.]|nr:acyl-CoA dehydrogenase family protein [Marmoricola sp.]
MHFARTEEQDELASIVRAMLDKRSGSEAVRAAVESDAGYDESLWQAMCEQVGVAALPVPEEHDGFGASLVETAIVLEELGRNLAPSPLLGTAIATAAVLAHADPAVQDELLPAVCGGETATLALDRLVLDPAARLVLRVSGDALERVDEPGVEVTGSLDQTLRLGRVTGAGTRIGDVPDVGALHHVAWALTSAVQVGTAQRGLDMTVAYSKERVQFGRPIGSFQALKHRMADLLVLVEASRSASWAATTAAASYVREPGEQTAAMLRRYAVVARSYCSDALDAVASETVQLHGGIAITWEHDAQLVLKRAHALSRLWAPAHRARAEALTRD